MAYKQQVSCEDCSKWRLVSTKPRRRCCSYDGAKISVRQSKRPIYCDFFEDLKLLDPSMAGWRAYIATYPEDGSNGQI